MSEREPVGTLAEEAAKLLAAVHVWAGDSTAASGDVDQDAADAGHDPAECHWCPLCRLVRMARSTSPEVREHLSQAAVSLALAVKGLLEDPVTTTRRETPLEKIDVTEE
jgi:hypothetical protein